MEIQRPGRVIRRLIYVSGELSSMEIMVYGAEDNVKYIIEFQENLVVWKY